MPSTIDNILTIIGPFNRYQWYLMAALAYCMINDGLQGLTMTFIANDPGWVCAANSSSCNYTGIIDSTMGEKYNERCHMQEKDWDFPKGASSIVTEFNQTCERSILKNIATSMVFLGWFLGAIIYGFISDKLGRKKALFISILLMAISGIIASFVKMFWLFAILKVITGSSIAGSMMCIYILITEFAGPKQRAFAGVFIWNFWTAGESLIALLAFLINDWRFLSLATSLPALLIIPMFYFLPESVRWLLVNDKLNKAEETLKCVARINKRQYPLDIQFPPLKASNGNVLELFKRKSTSKCIIISLIVWFSCSMVYYGVSLSSGRLGGNIYLVFFLTSIVSIPGNLGAIYVMNRFGRKKSLIGSLTGTSVAMISAALIPASNQGLVIGKVIFAMIAKFLNTIAFNAAYTITFETTPTTLRNAGMGLASGAARLGSFTASYVIYLVQVNQFLPFVVIGSCAVISAVLGFFLPETNGKPTKETMDDDGEHDQTQLMRES